MSTYKHLIVWQKSILLAKNIYTLSQTFPKAETFALASQMQRAAVSIASNIAEGNGRASRNEYVHFLSIARGSCFELDTQLTICREIGYKTPKELEESFFLLQEIGRILNAMIRSLSTNSKDAKSPNN